MGFIFQPVASEAPQWHRTFSRYAEYLDDCKPALEAIVGDYRKGALAQFASQGGYGSGNWKPLSAHYASWKQEQKPGAPILVFSGLLRKAATEPKVVITKDSLTLTIDDSGSYQVFSKRLGRIVTKHKPAVAGLHQTGVGRLPKRPVVELPESQRVRWSKIFQSWMIAQSRKGGR